MQKEHQFRKEVITDVSTVSISCHEGIQENV